MSYVILVLINEQ